MINMFALLFISSAIPSLSSASEIISNKHEDGNNLFHLSFDFASIILVFLSLITKTLEMKNCFISRLMAVAGVWAKKGERGVYFTSPSEKMFCVNICLIFRAFDIQIFYLNDDDGICLCITLASERESGMKKCECCGVKNFH
jgi:hypothetical protein